MQNFIILAILLAVVGGSVAYIIKEKKKGVRCVGCSMAGTCAAKAAGYGCGSNTVKSE
ncbi:MAG: FeoB-associated Cys-rich membrane protein [Oscillospiraceae bacterium]|nr:FeoB-associated Cys-rich membrane protein [Oscillospiraceae bacterium]